MTVALAQQQRSVYEQLCRYIDILGAPIIALYGLDSEGNCTCPKGKLCGPNGGKHPQASLCPKGVHSATTDKSRILQWIKTGLSLNWGIATGGPLPGGDYLVVLDCDPRNGSEETLENYDAVPRTPTQQTGGGGQHYLFKVPEQLSTSQPGPGLDLKGKGGYIVVEPSTHYSGKQYIWDSGLDLETPIAELPEWCTNTKKVKVRPEWTGKKAKDSVIGLGFKAAGWLGVELDQGKSAVNCPWSHNHTDGRGTGGDGSSVILPPTDENNLGGFKCSHSHCGDRTWRDAFEALPEDAKMAGRAGNIKLVQAPLVQEGMGVGVKAPRVTAALTSEELFEVRKHLQHKEREDGTWVLKKDFVNIVEIFRNDPRWSGVLSYDDFAHQIVVKKEPPWDARDKRNGFEPVYPRQWQDEDDIRAKLWLQRIWGVEWVRSVVNEAVVSVSQANGFHPVRNYLRSLEWDGVSRLDSWIIEYCGADDTEYARNVGRWWMISAVARIMKPGCKADHVLIFEGAQGTGKSTTFQILAGEWGCDSTISLGEKDAYQIIKGRWIIELAELDALTKADSSRAKAFFTSPTDTYRPSYGRAVVTVPRQCVFAGTVNHSQFLKDETGARRFWPVLTRDINTNKLRVDRDQLWAEAYKLYQANHRWWPEGQDEVQQCSVEQAQRESTDEWELLIQRFMRGPDAIKEMESSGYLTGGFILQKCLGMDPAHWGFADMNRVARCMQKLGYRKQQMKTDDGKSVWVFMAKL